MRLSLDKDVGKMAASDAANGKSRTNEPRILMNNLLRLCVNSMPSVTKTSMEVATRWSFARWVVFHPCPVRASCSTKFPNSSINNKTNFEKIKKRSIKH